MRKTVRIISLILMIVLVLGIFTNVKAEESSSEPVASESTDSSTTSPAPETATETITLSNTALTLKVDETKPLTATSSLEGQSITWTSDKDTVATVSTTGVVKGISAGSATITAKGKTATATCKVTVEAKEEPAPTVTKSDFSKAKISLTLEAPTASLNITGAVTDTSSAYYAMITDSNTKPTIPSEKTAKNGMLFLTVNQKDNSNLYVSDTAQLTKLVELNKDLYLWIVEVGKTSGATSFIKLSSGSESMKLTRYSEPNYTDAFFATFMAHNGDQIVMNFTNSGENNRNMQIKIGKITDTAILQKIKNQDSTGFGDLLKFAKTDKSFYNKSSEIKAKVSKIAYKAGTGSGDYLPVIDVGKNLVDNGYYYLYVKMDDENGKYINQEAVTLAMADVYKDGKWWMFFYGSSDFKWADFGNAGSGTTNKTPTDGTQMQGKLPQTGQSILIPIGVVTAIGVGLFFAKKYKKFDF